MSVAHTGVLMVTSSLPVKRTRPWRRMKPRRTLEQVYDVNGVVGFGGYGSVRLVTHQCT